MPVEPDLRKHPMANFQVVPALGKGVLTTTHELTGERIFEHSRTRPSDIQPGSEYRIELQSRLGTNWWTFEDEAEGKKFFEGMLPNQYGSWDAKATGPEACEKHYSEGWIYSYPLFDLKFTVNGNQQAVIKFVD